MTIMKCRFFIVILRLISLRKLLTGILLLTCVLFGFFSTKTAINKLAADSHLFNKKIQEVKLQEKNVLIEDPDEDTILEDEEQANEVYGKQENEKELDKIVKNTKALTEQTEKQTKVLLFTYGRAGSSFSGLLLKSGLIDGFYVYEPMQTLMKANDSITHNELLQGTFSCDKKYYDVLRLSALVRTRSHNSVTSENCQRASVILVKTIRVRLKESLQWLLRYPNVKIIYLVRDPRAIMTSTPLLWKISKQPELRCQQMESDFIRMSKISESRTKMVKYEDLVRDPMKQVEAIYNFLNVPWSRSNVDNFLKEHASNVTHQGLYFGLYQPRDYDPQHKWKQKSHSEIQRMESYCKKVLRLLNYPLYKDMH